MKNFTNSSNKNEVRSTMIERRINNVPIILIIIRRKGEG